MARRVCYPAHLPHVSTGAPWEVHMRTTVLLLCCSLSLAACSSEKAATIGDGGARDAILPDADQLDSALPVDDSSTNDAVVAGEDAPLDVAVVESGQEDASADATVSVDVGQSDVLQFDAYNYTPGTCDPGNDQCLGAPTFACRYSVDDERFMCPCIPGADPNCRPGEFCCGQLCYETATAPCL